MRPEKKGTPLVVRPEKKGPIAPEAPPRRRGVWKASLVAVAVVFGVAAVGWSRQGGDDFEFQLVGFDDDFDTGLPGGAWGEKGGDGKEGGTSATPGAMVTCSFEPSRAEPTATPTIRDADSSPVSRLMLAPSPQPASANPP